jgi:putative membrane protein
VTGEGAGSPRNRYRWEKQEADLATKAEVPEGVLPADPPNLGAMRTMMAADRTLMAWIRTSLSMLSFGYTIYKVLQELQEAGKILPHDTTPRTAGVFLSAAGTVALVMGVVEYSGTLHLLRKYYAFRLARPALIMATLMALTGVLLSVGILTRVL